jgi:GNAT superfamily N-acetyltransferase
MDDWQIVAFDRSIHLRDGFSCGRAPLDDFLRALVSQYEKRKLGKTYVAIRQEENRVLGYYTLASSAVSFEHLPRPASKKIPKHPVPVVLLARLAVDSTMQGKGLGAALLIDALQRALFLSQSLGIHAIEVDAIDSEAKFFYEKFGFTPLLDNALRLFLPITTIEDAFG